MAIHNLARMVLRALSYPDLDVKKTYRLERSVKKGIKAPFKPMYRLWDHKVYVDGRQILARIYPPQQDDGTDTLLFFHGGGWVTESVDTYNAVCHQLAEHMRCKVISVEYRLAPEHRFPDGLEDCYAVAKTLLQDYDAWRVFFPGKITLIGDSAGANLAAAVSLLARDRGEFSVARQILVYPSTYNDHSENSPFDSVRENGTDYLLTSKKIQDYMALYMRSEADLESPYFAPLLAEDLRCQPRTLILTAQYDPLRDEGEEYGRRLARAGNRVRVYRMKDTLHGFFSLGPGFAHVKCAYRAIRAFLDEDDDA